MIGSCDVCGEYCGDDDIDLASRHLEMAEAWPECEANGHEGPWHDPDGSPRSNCDHCGGLEAPWDTDLDHEKDCPICAWGGRAGRAGLLRLARARRPRPADAPRRLLVPVATGSIQDDLASFAAACRGYVRSTAPADRAQVEAALRDFAGPKCPPIRWVDSPVGVAEALGAAVAGHTPASESMREESVPERQGWALRTPEDRWQAETRGWLTRTLQAAVPGASPVTDHLATIRTVATVRSLLAPAVADRLASDEGCRYGDVQDLLVDAGQFDGTVWELAAAQALGREMRGTRRAYLELLVTLAASCGPVVVLAHEIVVSDRPVLLKVDPEGRLHAEGGPAIAYRDGLEAFAWRGVVVPEDVARDPAALTLRRIDATANVETRRVMIERFGIDRLIRDGGARLVHGDETGRLWQRPMEPLDWWGGRGEPIQMVEVENSTPEPDGSRRTYFLRVPPTMRTARDAVAWTFGLGGGEYRPAAES